MTELGELASYMENPLDRSLPNYPMGRGSVASHVYFDGYVSIEGLLWHLADIRAPQHKTFC